MPLNHRQLNKFDRIESLLLLSFITFPESMAAKGGRRFSLSVGLSLELMDSLPTDLRSEIVHLY